MKKIISMVAVSAAMLVLVAGSASAQEGGSSAALGGGATPPADYVTQGGYLVHEGDISVPCSSVSSDDYPEGARLCRETGFPFSSDPEGAVRYDQYPGADDAGALAASAQQPSVSVSPAVRPSSTQVELPATGGPSLLIPVAAGGVIL